MSYGGFVWLQRLRECFVRLVMLVGLRDAEGRLLTAVVVLWTQRRLRVASGAGRRLREAV